MWNSKNTAVKELIVLGILSAFCFSLCLFRVYYTDLKMYLFLIWNLFLAFIPWFISTLMKQSERVQKSNLLFLMAFSAWLLFFPNAPYILTDLFHLKSRARIPIWFDLILLLSFAWTGLLYGILSLAAIESLLSKKLGAIWTKLLITGILFLSAFGVYLGRYLRWNSWDILQDPMGLFYDIAARFIYPLEHPRTWGMTIVLGVFLNVIYWSYKSMKVTKSTELQKG